MHHKNHKNSTANHSNPSQHKPAYPSAPAPQSGTPKRSVLSRIRDRFQEKPATADEVKQLALDAKREQYKTLKAKAKAGRPSRFSGFGGPPPSRRSSRSVSEDSGLFGGGGSGNWLLGEGNSGPSLSFITGEQKQVRGRKQDSGFGKGLSDLF